MFHEKRPAGWKVAPTVLYRRKELTGERFGKLTVLRRSALSKCGAAWVCRCDCGTEKVIYLAELRLKKSCGC